MAVNSTSSGTVSRSRLFRLPATTWIIIITSFTSLVLILFGQESAVNAVALTPARILAGSSIWTLVTHIFFHSGFLHLFVNMFSLFFIGNITEQIIGRKRFIWFYLLSGIFAGIVFVLTAWIGTKTGLTSVFGSLDFPGIGASGALFGVLGILAVLLPNKRVYLIVGPLIAIFVQYLISPFLSDNLSYFFNIFLNLIVFLMILSMLNPLPIFRKIAVPLNLPMWLAPILAIVPLVVLSFFFALPIANTAHFGGLLAGLLYGWYLRVRYRRKVAMLQRVFR